MPSTALPNGRTPSRFAVLTSLLLALGAALFALQQVFDGDLWWHLATGRWVVETGSVPRADPFSFATAGAPWVAHSWLADVAIYLLHRWGGLTAILVAKVAIVGGAFALAAWLAVRAGACPWVTLLSLASAIPIAQPQFRERPQILMFALVPLSYWLLGRDEAERRRSTWAALVPATIAWSNLHGSFFLGVALAGALLADRVARLTLARIRRAPAPSGDFRSTVLSAALVAALLGATAVNAYGLALPLQILRDFTSFAVQRTAVIEEHRALVFADNPGFLALSALTLVALVASGRRLRPFDVAAFAGFGWLALSSERFAAIAALLDACILARTLSPHAVRAAEALAVRLPRLPTLVLPSLALATAALGLTLAFRTAFAPGRETQWGLGVNEGRFPSAAVRVLSAAGYAGNVFNSWELGGYLLWHLPGSKDLVDGRALPAHFELLDGLSRLDPAAFGRWLEEHGAGAALLVRRDPFLPFFSTSSSYALAASDDRSVLYVRRDVASRSGITLRRFRLIHPEQPDPSYLLPLSRGAEADEVERELRRAAEADPGDFNATFQLGFFLEARGRPEAIDLYVAAARLSPGMAFGHHDLGVRAGVLALNAGRLPELEPFLRDALRVNAKSAPLETLLGTSLQLQNRMADAEKAYGRALALDPGYAVALKNLGFLFLGTQRPAEAAGLLAKAREAMPGEESAAYGLAAALELSGDPRGALLAWRHLLDRFPSGRWAPMARARLGERVAK